MPGILGIKARVFEVRKGEIVGIIGKNGSRKSLLQIIAGTLMPTEGEIKINGHCGFA